MSDFEDAVKQLGMPICPCGEMRELERIVGSLWHCAKCQKHFTVASAPKPDRPGLFKVLPR